MTEQQIDRDRLRASAESALACGTFDEDVLSAVPALLDALDQAEAELDSWMARAYEAEGKLWKAEARIKAVEDVLDAEEARPRPIGGGYDKRALVRIADIRRALESDPPPRPE